MLNWRFMMTGNVGRELSNAKRSAGFRCDVAAILLATVVMLCGSRGAATADESDKEASAKPSQEANEPAAVATLRVRKIDTDDECDEYRKTQLQLIKSPFVLASALRVPGISNLEALRAEKDQLGWLRERIQATAAPDSDVLQIRMRGADPKELQQIVNAVAQAYLTDVVNKPKGDAITLLNMKQAKLNELIAELEALKMKADLPANGNADGEARRKHIEQLEVMSGQMALSIQASAVEIQSLSRVEFIDETSVGDGSAKSPLPR
jgi:hypothetical protein